MTRLNAWKILLMIGMLELAAGQRSSVTEINLCKEQKNKTFEAGRSNRDAMFNASSCGWAGRSLILLQQTGFDDCRLSIQDQEFCDFPARTCIIISKNFNVSSNPMMYFSNCERIVWTPMGQGDIVTVSMWRRQLTFQYEFAAPSVPVSTGIGRQSNSTDSSHTVIALAALFAITFLGLIVLLIIMFKGVINKAGTDIKSRCSDKNSNGSSSVATGVTNNVYAMAEDASVYHEVSPQHQHQVTQNELYTMA